MMAVALTPIFATGDELIVAISSSLVAKGVAYPRLWCDSPFCKLLGRTSEHAFPGVMPGRSGGARKGGRGIRGKKRW